MMGLCVDGWLSLPMLRGYVRVSKRTREERQPAVSLYAE